MKTRSSKPHWNVLLWCLSVSLLSGASHAQPYITTHPVSQTVSAGSDAKFTVEAAGTAPLSYQWRFKGEVITGANSTSYTVVNAQPVRDEGAYSVRVSNAEGWVTSSDATLTVLAPPVISVGLLSPTDGSSVAQGTPVTLSATASSTGGTITKVEFFDGGTSLGEVSSAPYSLTLSDLPCGAHVLTAKATDSGGFSATSASVTISVVDTTAPTITCPADVAAKTGDDGTGDCLTTVALGAPTVSDNCTAVADLKVNNDAPAKFGKGETLVTWTVQDAAGNKNTCTQKVTVVDDEAPAITCPSAVSVLASSRAGAVVNFTVTATDACDPAPTVTCSPVSGSVFVIGTTPVSCAATDASGNFDTCLFPVRVREVMARRSLDGVIIIWAIPGTVLEAAPKPTGPWTEVPGATSPYNPPTGDPRTFYRLRYP